jgi:hypothetical protein
MKHAGPAALDRLEPLLAQLRRHPRLKEKSRGAFYRGSRAFLHFHEHGEEFYADIRLTDDFERFPATKACERKALMARVAEALGDGKAAPPRSTLSKHAGKRS